MGKGEAESQGGNEYRAETLPKGIDYELLKQMKLGEGLTKEQMDQLGIIAAGALIDKGGGKRMYAIGASGNSDEFKKLGTLHKEERTMDYFP